MTMQNTKIARRDVLLVGSATGLAVSMAGLVVTTLAGAKADKTLLDLLAEWNRAYALFEDAIAEVGRAEIAAQQHYPKQPECGATPSAYANLTHIEVTIREEYEGLLITKEESEALKVQTEALDVYQTECDEINERFRVPEREEKRDQLCDRACEIETQMAETPARSMAGVAIKLMVWRKDQNFDELIVSAAEDVQRLSGVVS